ncbi:unnamed protein product [Boreogadus saida]
MFRNPWISGYHVSLEHEGFDDKASPRLCASVSFPTRTLSFQSDLLVIERSTLVKSVSDIDLLAVLPKVSELKKQFEKTRASDSGMNRKERVARRLEGFEGDAPPALVPGGPVANRMLEEDSPRYTRASDHCEPRLKVRRYTREEMDAPQTHAGSPDRSSSRVRVGGGGGGTRAPAHTAVRAEPVSASSGASSSAAAAAAADGGGGGLSSKAERIARYKAERRRQLSERYGILLDQEPDLDYTPRYRSRREGPQQQDPPGLQQPPPPPLTPSARRDRDRDRQAVGEDGPEPRVPYSSGVGRVHMRTQPEKDSPAGPGPGPGPGTGSGHHAHPAQAPPPTHERPGRFSERERAMNTENHRRGGGGGGAKEHAVAAATSRPRSEEQQHQPPRTPQQQHPPPPQHQHHPPPPPPPEPGQPSSSSGRADLSVAAAAAAAAVPSSPRSGGGGRRNSLPSPRYGVSPGDLFIEQQAQSILSRQGIRARERIPRDEAVHRPSEWSPDSPQGNRPPQRQAGGDAPQYAVKQQQQHSDSPDYQRSAAPPRPHPESEPTGGPAGTGPPGPPEVQRRRRVSADQIYATHREARLEARQEARQALKAEPHTAGLLLKSRKAVLPSEIRRRERSQDGGQSDDGEPQTLSPRMRRATMSGDDRKRERPAERGLDHRVRGPVAAGERSTGGTRQGLDGQEGWASRWMEPQPPPPHATPPRQHPQQQQQQQQQQLPEQVYHREPVRQHQPPLQVSHDPPKREQYEPPHEAAWNRREGDGQRDFESRQPESQRFQRELQRRPQEIPQQPPQEAPRQRHQQSQLRQPQEFPVKRHQEIPLQHPRGIPLQHPQELQRRPREIPQQRPEETPRQRQQEIPLQHPQEIPRQQLQEIPTPRPREIPPQHLHEIQLQRPQEIPRQRHQEIPLQQPQEIPRHHHQEIQLQHPREIPPQHLQEIPGKRHQEIQLQHPEEIPRLRHQEIQLQHPREIPPQHLQEIPGKRHQEIQLQHPQEIPRLRHQEIQLQHPREIPPQHLREIPGKRHQEIQLQRPQEPQIQRRPAPTQGVPQEHRRSDLAVHLQDTSSTTSRQSNSSDGGRPKPKVRVRSMSDVGMGQRPAMYRAAERAAAAGREVALASAAPGLANGEVGPLDTRVSVARLRHSYLENANRKPELEPAKVEPSAAVDVEPAPGGGGGGGGAERDGGVRRPRRYITPGQDSRTSERFRTQPVTSAERMESHRSRMSPTQHQEADATDEQTLDERAKMSVAAKRSLFRELERASDGGGGVPKPRSRNVAVERRLRRVQDRSHTQPVTSREVDTATTDTDVTSHPVVAHTAARNPSPTLVKTTATSFSTQSTPLLQERTQGQEQEHPDPREPQRGQPPPTGGGGDQAGEGQGVPSSDEPDLSSLSLAEKMALFNRLSGPQKAHDEEEVEEEAGAGAGARVGDTRLRRANARFQTQPITQGEVDQEAEPTGSTPALSSGGNQGGHLQNGGGAKLEPLSAALVRSVAAVTSHASVTTVAMATSRSSSSGGGVRERDRDGGGGGGGESVGSPAPPAPPRHKQQHQQPPPPPCKVTCQLVRCLAQRHLNTLAKEEPGKDKLLRTP